MAADDKTAQSPKPTKKRSASKPTDRVAIVAGLRTPFAKQSTHYKKTNAIELGKMVVSEMIARNNLDLNEIERVVFGQVAVMPEAPNIAREIVLGTNMSPATDAYSVSRACATSFQSAVSIAESIQAGAISVGIAGGADSASVLPFGVSKRLGATLLDLSKAKTAGQRLKLISKLRPSDLMPVPPAVKEYSTGLRMGDNAEQMARDRGITREQQDQLAHRSHTLAAQAWEAGLLDEEVMTGHVPPYSSEPLERDNLVRFDSELAGYARLKPVFDRKYGTVTAANASPLTDGAAALLLMSEKKAKALGLQANGVHQELCFCGAER